MDSVDSPLGLAIEIDRLLNKMPQSLCCQRGLCCKFVTFNNFLDVPEILAVAGQTEPTLERESARDFLNLFIKYDDPETVRAQAPAFVERIEARAREKNLDPETVVYYGCRYLAEDNRCQVHEDRPVGCRRYPSPLPGTLFHPGCGFEDESRIRWEKVRGILESLGIDPAGVGKR